MNRIFLLFFACSLVGCSATQSANTIFAKQGMSAEAGLDKAPQAPISKLEDKAVTLLNQLFNSDAANKKMVLVINNESDCDFTMNILGGKSYVLPVASRKTESIVVEQGEYEMKSEVCKSPYQAHKSLVENTQVNIRYSVVKNAESGNLETNQ